MPLNLGTAALKKRGYLSCRADSLAHQPFPTDGMLLAGLDRSLPKLGARLRARGDTVYSYIIKSVKQENGRLVQTGSAPNFQGGYITLCTCKHHMRTFLNCDEWKGAWIAGFTGVKAGGGQNALVYLMKVLHAFPSHRDLWFSKAIPPEMRRAKAAHLSTYGDVFMPRNRDIRPFDPVSYRPPCKGHSHRKSRQWVKDICYRSPEAKPAALLVGDPQFSFIWSCPTIFSGTRLYRGQKRWTSLNELLSKLGSDQ